MMSGDGDSGKNIEKFSKSDRSERRLDSPDAQEAREADQKTISEIGKQNPDNWRSAEGHFAIVDESQVLASRDVTTDSHEATGSGSAEETGTVIDYEQKRIDPRTFSLGMDYEDGRDTRTPSEKIGDFLKAAANRATDPHGWQDYLDGQVEKFIGIGEGLNVAKDHTKEAVVTGWTALTDGTVANFLSKPNALNDPLFNTVGTALDAMSKDPYAVNHAMERLGQGIMNASEQYTNLPDREKGKVIGEFMFFMVNPEGSTEAGEAALKVADTVATHVDRAVIDGLKQSHRAIEEIAAATPELAEPARRLLYEHIQKLNLSSREVEMVGIPKGYFDGIEPIPTPSKTDNAVFMSASDDIEGGSSFKGGRRIEGELVEGVNFQVDKATGRLQRTDLGEIRKQYHWPVINERFAPDVVRQANEGSCISAAGEMISKGKFSESELMKYVKVPGDMERLASRLGDGWTNETRLGITIEEMSEHGPFAVMLGEYEWVPGYGVNPPQAVVVDGLNEVRNVVIRDPLEGTRYEMTIRDFKKSYCYQAVYRTKPMSME